MKRKTKSEKGKSKSELSFRKEQTRWYHLHDAQTHKTRIKRVDHVSALRILYLIRRVQIESRKCGSYVEGV